MEQRSRYGGLLHSQPLQALQALPESLLSELELANAMN